MPGHCLEAPQWRSKLVHTTEIQAGSHNRDPRWFAQWKAKVVHTMEVQAVSHNGDPNWFPKHIRQWRSKPVPTTEIRTGSQNTLHNGDPRRFTQRRSKPVPTVPLVGDLRPHPPLYVERCPAIAWRVHKIYKRMANMKKGSSGNGDPSVFTQSRSKQVPTTKIQTGYQNTLHYGDPSRFTQRRSKPVPTIHKCPRQVT